jgi:hypothetical protein
MKHAQKQFTVIFFLLLHILPVSAQTQTGSDSIIAVDTALLNIYKQMMIFPQEKIYMQTDKPYYMAGETVFYRLFLLDACFHVPFPASRYVYVELIDQTGSVDVRQKLRPENGGMYYGSIKLSGHLAQGYYKIRAYTRFMENRGAENLYSKPLFVIAENREHLKMEMNVSAKDKKRTSVELRFINAGTGAVAMPADIFLQLNGKKQKAGDRRDDGVFEFELPLTDEDRERRLYVEVLNEEDSVIFKQFDAVPYAGDSIELTFYPEGGYLVEGQPNAIAFKALGRDGRPAEITGSVVDADGTAIAGFSTGHDGMGLFHLIADSGKNCHVEYESGGRQRRIPLPDFKRNPFSLRAAWKNGRLLVSVNSEKDAPLPKMYLLVHCRGDMLYFNPWNEDGKILAFEKELLRTGVNHLILLSEDYHPLSERIVFCNKNDHIVPEIITDRQDYKNREHVVMNFQAGGGTKDISPEDSIHAGFSVSVTADSDVQTDTATNILTEILLESELKGMIANPAYYFGNTPEAESHADLLMMTHGWTRYDIPKAMRGDPEIPAVDPETSQTLSGKVKGGIIPRSASNIEVAVMSHQGKEKYYGVTKTDENGLFRFENFELPDSSEIVVQALKGNKRKKGLLEVLTDTIEYPPAGDFGLPQYYIKTSSPFIEEMIAATDWRYVYIDGVRMIQIPEVVIKKRFNKKPKYDNFYNIEPDFVMTVEEIKESGIKDVLTLIDQLPYVTVRHRGQYSTVEVQILDAASKRETPVVSVNGVYFHDEHPLDILLRINVNDIGEIHVINRHNKMITSGMEGAIIAIITKDGKFYDRRQRFHFKSLMPLGYATPAAFYSPRYDTPASPDSDIPDLRTTIYWKPDVIVAEDGKASVDFYTADAPTTYSVVMEGISPDGTLIYGHKKAVLKVGK